MTATQRKLERLCFGWHGREAGFDFRPGLAGAAGLPRSNDNEIGALAHLHNRSGNRGYLVIGEATMRLFDCDRDLSASLDLRRLLEWEDPERLAAAISARFDALVLPMAYEIAPGFSYDRLVVFLETVTLPVVTLGLGIHCDPDDSIDLFHPSVRSLLRVLDRRAALFGVRAETTRCWLERHGFRQAVALGCPSLHLYPSTVQALEKQPLDMNGSIATGGYLLRNDQRARWQCQLFGDHDATYILQDELFTSDHFHEDTPIINDATGTVDRTLIVDAVQRRIGLDPPFSRYAYFHGLDAWRLCCAYHELYIGDRFHGAIVALQVGRPIALFTKDVRTRELSAFYGIPTVELEDVFHHPLRDVVSHSLDQPRRREFVETWHQRHHRFLDTLRSVGLTFTAGSDRTARSSRSNREPALSA